MSSVMPKTEPWLPAELQVIGELVVVTPQTTQLDEAACHRILECVRPWIESGHHLVLDFSDVTFIGSSALGMLATLYREQRSTDSGTYLCGVRPGPSEVLALTNINRLVAGFFDSVDQACTSLEAGAI